MTYQTPSFKPVPDASIAMVDQQQAATTGTVPLSLENAMALAHRLNGENRPADALGVLEKIIAKHSELPEALHLYGVVLHQLGDTEKALYFIDKAIAKAPENALYFTNRAEMSRLLGDLDNAIKYGRRAVKLDKKLAIAHSNLGIAHYDNGDSETAEHCHHKALKLNSDCLPSLNNMGSIMRDRKQSERAIEYYQQAIERAGGHLEAFNNLAAVYNEEDRPSDALKIAALALQRAPDYAEAHSTIGNAFFLLNDLTKSLAAFTNAQQLKPDLHAAYLGIGRVRQEENKLEEARQQFLLAVDVAPEKSECYAQLASVLNEMGDSEAAAQYFQQALAIDSACKTSRLGLANWLMESGRVDEAEKYLQSVLREEPDSMPAQLSLVQLKKVSAEDQHFTNLCDRLADAKPMLPAKAYALHYALGKGFEDQKEYDQAFSHYMHGAKIKRSTISHDIRDAQREMGAIAAYFDEQAVARLSKYASNSASKSATPILIVGMPRSGTTLTEQIIGSHRDVFGAGELPLLMQAAYSGHAGTDNPYAAHRHEVFPAFLGSQDAEIFQRWTHQYPASLAQLSPTSKHIIDKMPANFYFIGLLHALLPKAKIIHISRNPVDVCVSGFCRLFNRSQFHSYDLREMGQYYVEYAKLMQHWRKVLPANAFYELQYEELVADNENQVRQLLDYCELAWDDACLQSHKSKRQVRTASVMQVREPIYQSSIEKWRRYEGFLQPLLDELGALEEI